ncbi:Hypothetical protein DEACI_3117 [Acididesulfobacillus acetoxydans]|uniref:Uncharacterized protein n=1 Tax=Acididesulfobacillus acetoxydans TaxID=1561005 RepID=A0A8S0VXZ2_9FIRM|nr:Hypothetical protein DEACI_3117 [Acididesulfobacillus acetoxydans]CEJ05898.1 Hypothetical protein DEACI_0318 [Acididesulfobacillus acetoxydans]
MILFSFFYRLVVVIFIPIVVKIVVNLLQVEAKFAWVEATRL